MKDLRINEQIRSKDVRLIQGEEQNVVSLKDALILASEQNLDLVEIAPDAVPPVCKILDYGKYKFEQEKKIKDTKKNQHIVKLKEVRMQPHIEDHDLSVESKQIKTFLNEGNKIKVSVRFRGRELAHTDIGRVLLEKILDELVVDGVVFNLDQKPKMESRVMTMALSPKSKK